MILFVKVLPIFAAMASFAPFLGVIHWAKVINPAYRGTPKKVTTNYNSSQVSCDRMAHQAGTDCTN